MQFHRFLRIDVYFALTYAASTAIFSLKNKRFNYLNFFSKTRFRRRESWPSPRTLSEWLLSTSSGEMSSNVVSSKFISMAFLTLSSKWNTRMTGSKCRIESFRSYPVTAWDLWRTNLRHCSSSKNGETGLLFECLVLLLVRVISEIKAGRTKAKRENIFWVYFATTILPW